MPNSLHVVTDDGWRIALKYFERSPHVAQRRPVLCCHGLASNHLAFDVGPTKSLARYLAACGHDVAVIDLRGHGDSERGPFRWCFDDYLKFDLPAAVARLATHTSADRIHYIGHSMGGLLGYSYLASFGAAKLHSLTTIGSSLDYSSSATGFDAIAPLTRVLELMPSVPVDVLARLSGLLTFGAYVSPYERFNIWPSNCDRALWRKICRYGFEPVSPGVLLQLRSALSPGGLRSADGSVCYLEQLAGANCPLLALAGDRDEQCSAAAVELTAAAVAGSTVLAMGVDGGQQDHYGHFDLLMGCRVVNEVYAPIARFLASSEPR